MVLAMSFRQARLSNLAFSGGKVVRGWAGGVAANGPGRR